MTRTAPPVGAANRTMTRAHRLDVALRLIVAVGGGYALATLSALALAHVLPLPPGDAERLGGMLAFIVFAGVTIWAIAARRQRVVWLGVALACLACAAVIALRPGTCA